jgi:glutamate--cysteine ligase catalytic subunit
MDKAYGIDAVLKNKFLFKTSILPHGKENYQKSELAEAKFLKTRVNPETPRVPEEYHELYLHEILAGKPELNYVGIYPLIDEFMAIKNYSADQKMEVKMYLDFLLARAKGEVKTDAKFIRDFVMNHEKYEKDSYVRDEIMFDLLKTIDTMSRDDYNMRLFQVNKEEEEDSD